EDAFQATFLALVRRAAHLARRGALGAWLHTVARRTALKARARDGKRRAREREAATLPSREPDDSGWHELWPLLDEELSRLPERYRMPISLCALEERPTGEGARQLGCPQGTLASRLARGRAMLARRLTRRGLTLAGGAVPAALSRSAVAAAVPVPLVAAA